VSDSVNPKSIPSRADQYRFLAKRVFDKLGLDEQQTITLDHLPKNRFSKQVELYVHIKQSHFTKEGWGAYPVNLTKDTFTRANSNLDAGVDLHELTTFIQADHKAKNSEKHYRPVFDGDSLRYTDKCLYHNVLRKPLHKIPNRCLPD
jgi:hypothetical protein